MQVGHPHMGTVAARTTHALADRQACTPVAASVTMKLPCGQLQL